MRIWTFASSEYDEEEARLWIKGEPIKLGERVLLVLKGLLETPGHQKSSVQLARIWGPSGSIDSVKDAIRHLRGAFENGGVNGQVIKTIRGIGFQIVVQVEVRNYNAGELLGLLRRNAPAPMFPGWTLGEQIELRPRSLTWEIHKDRQVRVVKYAADSARRAAFGREVKAWREIEERLPSQRAYVRVFGAHLSTYPCYIETEFGGIALSSWFDAQSKQNSVPLATRLQIVADLSDALADVHEIDIVHNHVRPTAILIQDPSGDAIGSSQRKISVKLANFSMSVIGNPNRTSALDHPESKSVPDAASGKGKIGLYTAPENVGGAPGKKSSDVYALGVILYQILCGDFVEPFTPEWEGRVGDPLLIADIAAAAHKDPDRRISARKLAENLRSLSIRREKYAAEIAERARNRAIARALDRANLLRPWIVLTILALLTGLCASLWFAHRAYRDRRLAEADAAREKRLMAFTESLFTSGEDRVPEKGMTVETLLHRGEQQVRGLDSDRPEQAEMLQVIGSVYGEMGLFDRSDKLLADSLRIREQVFGISSRQVAETLVKLSELRDAQGREQEALGLAQRAFQADARLLPADAPETLRAQAMIATALIGLGQYQDVVKLLQMLIDNERGKPDRIEDYSNALGLLSMSYVYLGNRDDAMRLVKEGLAVDRARLGNRHPDVGADLINKSQLEHAVGDNGSAESDGREALAIYRDWFGPEHYEVASAETTLSDALIAENKADEVTKLLGDAVRIQKAYFSMPNEKTAHTLVALGRVELQLHHPAKAIEALKRAEEQYHSLFPYGDARSGVTLFSEAEVYIQLENLTEAQKALEKSIQMESGRVPTNDKRLVDARLLLGEVFLAKHQPEAAQPLLLEVVNDAVACGHSCKEEKDQAFHYLKILEDEKRRAISH